MPYNTRRKSLSLPSLGIHLPASSRRSPQNHPDDQQFPPSKKVKRSHDSPSLSPEPPRRATGNHIPPPSPMDDIAISKIDTEGINDDIVVGVIQQLEKTANRPHLVKELAAVLVTLNDNVANSANPAALLSSRLSAYMKRSWSAIAPCPIAKELIPIHPRKVYYYLSTMPRQPLPENSDDVVIPTPSVSSVDRDDEDFHARQRSPSPEVDLSFPDFEDEGPVSLHGRPNCSSRSSHAFGEHHPTNMRLMHSHRATSPPLEGDEKEFTQTASAVRERASERKATQLQQQTGGGRSGISEGLSQANDDGSMSVSGTPLDDGSFSSSVDGDRVSDDEYSDYFSHSDTLGQHTQQEDQQKQSDDAACALFGTSPSPSLTSVASSLSSTAPSEAGLDSEERPQISLPEDPETTHVSPVKRSIHMLNSGFPDVDIKMSDLADQEDKVTIKTGPAENRGVEMGFDSWKELQSPETVEVDELDEMFGEI